MTFTLTAGFRTADPRTPLSSTTRREHCCTSSSNSLFLPWLCFRKRRTTQFLSAISIRARRGSQSDVSAPKASAACGKQAADLSGDRPGSLSTTVRLRTFRHLRPKLYSFPPKSFGGLYEEFLRPTMASTRAWIITQIPGWSSGSRSVRDGSFDNHPADYARTSSSRIQPGPS